MSAIIRWEDPPPNGSTLPGKRTKWAKIADQLRAAPGRWAVVDTKDTHQKAAASANQVRRGAYVGMTAGQFEAVARGRAIYARYVGETS